MIKNIDVSQVVKSDLLIKEPVRVVNKRITGNKNHRVVLTGGSGTGKSIILKTREKESIGSDTPAIYTAFDREELFGKKFRNTDFMEHYYELLMSYNFLYYIQCNYPELYKNNFHDLEELTDRYLREALTFEKLSKSQIRDSRKFFAGEILSEVVSRFRSLKKPDRIELLVDDYDKTNNTDKRSQDILRKYFSMFEKVVVTSSDPKILTGEYNRELSGIGFDTVEADYCFNDSVVRDIALARGLSIPQELLTESDYQKLIKRSEGNIDLMLACLKDAESIFTSSDDDYGFPSEALDACSKVKCPKYKRLVKKCSPSKFYL